MSEDKLTKKMYGWSKYGGARMGMVKEELPEWFCQSCQRKHTKELPAYLLPLDDMEREFVRVCSDCKRTSVTSRVVVFTQLIRITRTKSYIANLPSIPDKV